ncbi:nucleoid-associated protein [Tenacibaculum maritimum]|uniref:nucleoid-associated protein n=2 Tax=Tenacibaculum maritimum TaxID=107401 RepID=UPI00040C4E34|nr:nucleoid-associated protein [Tenacibaculum maritimum]MDB0599811.1 nucleoid-associated protein [Tenacibaculum maritimum]MDB0610921.1 nucleoid-associated protein [Tenacibaculum maritimum]CAA0230549.1 conserved hypothetical protein [Tenacibaculum maritimum]
MIKITRAEISKCIIHKVANKYIGGGTSISEELVRFDEKSYEILLSFLLKPFGSLTQSYRFTHQANIPLKKIAKNIFEDEGESNFIDNSKNIVSHLYHQSNKATIKKGDVLIVLFEGIEYKDVLTEAIGIFKIENKVNFFQTFREDESFDIALAKGISTRKLDKGCLILNMSDTEGPVILSVDNNNYDAQYWIKNFLNVQYADDRNLHTKHYLEMCEYFSENIIQPEFGKQEQSRFLANTVDYFKEHESVDHHDFKQEVFEVDKHKELFEGYKKQYETLTDVLIRNNFEVSDSVLKKAKSKFKTDIKLDTNIQIKIDIDAPDASSEYLEKGYDENKKMKFYKVFFNDER